MLNQYEHYVIEEANFHLQRAKEILEIGMLDPEKYYRNRQHYRALRQVRAVSVPDESAGSAGEEVESVSRRTSGSVNQKLIRYASRIEQADITFQLHHSIIVEFSPFKLKDGLAVRD